MAAYASSQIMFRGVGSARFHPIESAEKKSVCKNRSNFEINRLAGKRSLAKTRRLIIATIITLKGQGHVM